jgi:hypothetical protein
MARYKAQTGDTAGRMLDLAGELARTGVKSGEVGVASVQTIGYRTAMMAAAFGNPIAMANPEFVRMGSEKVEAAMEASQAMAKGLSELGRAWVALLSGQSNLAAFTMGLGTCRTPVELMTLQQHAMKEAVDASLGAGLRLVEAYSAIASAGLAPVHRTVSANARRLARTQG